VLGWRSTFAACILFGLALGTVVFMRLPETIRARSREPLSFLAILRGFRTLLAHPTYRLYVAFSSLAYGGLFSFISASCFVLQRHYGLPELPYAFSFAFVVLGFMGGTTLAQRLVPRRGLDGTIGAGVAALAGGGVGMLVLVLAGTPTSLAVTGPMTLYAMGVGLTMPQSMASAMGPFPDRAGAASSLLGLCQMTFAAVLGIALGHSLDGGGALPLPIAIAGAGLVALTLFHATKRVRAV